MVILPSTFVGSPRYMPQKYYDAMTIVRHSGRPDLLITFTYNPKFPEILSQLQVYQDASARPDIVSRVFQLMVEEFMRPITKEKIFVTILAFVYVIEWQKRGLPHIHSCFGSARVTNCNRATKSIVSSVQNFLIAIQIQNCMRWWSETTSMVHAVL